MRLVLPTTSAARRHALVPAWAWTVLLVLALASRLPLQSAWLYHWDSLNFAFALDRFDVEQGQPHAPGYLLYVLLGRGAAWLTGDAQRGYVLLAIIGSALAAVALYELGRRLWDAATGWLAALLLLSSPLFWFYGEVALPHTLDALAVIGAALLSWRVAHDERASEADGRRGWYTDPALLLALWLGVAGGLRPQTLVFLLPLALVAGWHMPWRRQLGALTLLTVVVLLWLIPLLLLSGGLWHYLAVVGRYSAEFDRPTSMLLGAGWNGLRHNLDKLARYTLWGWAGGMLLLPGLALAGSTGARWWQRNHPAWLLLLWVLPCLLFYSLIHMGQQGLIFVYLPVLLLLSARGGVLLARRGRAGVALVVVGLALNLGLYLGAPVELVPGRFKVLSQATIRQHDALIAGQIAAARYDLPADTLLLAHEWRFAQYYVPEAALVPYRLAADDATAAIDLDSTQTTLIRQAHTLAWYEPELDRFNNAPERTTLMPERQGVRLRVLQAGAGEVVYVAADGFGVRGDTHDR